MLLCPMQQLLGNKQLDGSLLQELIVSCLFLTCSLTSTSASSAASVEDLAKMADKVVESTTPLAPRAIQAAMTDPGLADL